MALEWLKSRYDEVSKSLKTEVTKVKSRQFLESTIAAVVVVSYADGMITPDEKTKMMGFLRNNEMLSVFDSDLVIELFNKYAGKYEFDRGIGESECLATIGKLKSKPQESRLLVRVCCAIGAADGNFDDDEKKAVRGICAELGLDPADFDLT